MRSRNKHAHLQHDSIRSHEICASRRSITMIAPCLGPRLVLIGCDYIAARSING